MKSYIIGVNAVIERLKNFNAPVELVYLDPAKKGGRIDRILELAKGRKVAVVRDKPPQELSDQKHQGVVVVVPESGRPTLESVLAARKSPSTVLVLDSITDPRNLGACIRSAAAAGVDGVFIPKHNSAGLNPAATKAAAGAIEHVAVVETTNLSDLLKKLKDSGYWIAGAAADGPIDYDLLDVDLDLAIVIGSEGKGMRSKVASSCDFLINIPMAGAVESLNASVAAAIILFDISGRRRRK